MVLIAVGQTVATEFATVAAANDYWQKSIEAGSLLLTMA